MRAPTIDITTQPRKSGVIAWPASVAVPPRTACTNSGMNAINPKSATPTRKTTSIERAITGDLNKSSGSSGSAARRSRITNAVSRAMLAAVHSQMLPPTSPPSAISSALTPEKSRAAPHQSIVTRSEEHTSELQSLAYLVCRLLLEKKKKKKKKHDNKTQKNKKNYTTQYKINNRTVEQNLI